MHKSRLPWRQLEELGQKMANKFERGEIVVMKSGGPPMTVNKVPGDPTPYGAPLEVYYCEWFKGATSQSGQFAEHLLNKYVPPK